MAPKGKRPRQRRMRMDSVTFPLAYELKEGEVRITTIATIAETFDRARPFRIARLWGKLGAVSAPVLFQWEFFGPLSSADNVWVSPMMLAVPNGTRFRFNIPVTICGWFPSDTATNTTLFRLSAICIDKKDASLIGMAQIKVHLQPREVDRACPRLMIRPPPAESQAACSSASISVISEDSDSDEYFSC